MGITKNPSEQILAKILILIAFGLNVISQYINISIAPNTFEEYTECIYFTSVGTMIFVIYIIVIFEREKLFEFIDEIEKTLQNSEGKKFREIFCFC